MERLVHSEVICAIEVGVAEKATSGLALRADLMAEDLQLVTRQFGVSKVQTMMLGVVPSNGIFLVIAS